MKKLITAGMLLAALSGCSSIVSQSEYAVAIATNPEAANFVITNKEGKQVSSGVTPATITLKSSAGYFKGESYTVEFKKEGFESKLFTLNSTVDGWYFGNILFGGLIGMLIVDPATGAMYNLPKRVDVNLSHSVADAGQDELTIATIDSLSESDKQRLVRIN